MGTAVHLNHQVGIASSTLVQPVNVLGDDAEQPTLALKVCNGQMTVVRLR